MTEQSELDQLAEAELQRLMYQLRIIDIELKSLLDEKRCHLTKQNRIISLMYTENEKLKSDVACLQKVPHSTKENEIETMLEQILAQHTDMLKVFEQEKINLWELETHIKKIEKEITTLRKNEVSDGCYKIAICKVQKDVVKLENRLDVTNKKCSAVLTLNIKLRKTIDHMLQDRAHFNDLWQVMVAQFNNGKNLILDLIDQSTVAYDQREELCNKLQSLKDKNESDKLVHIQEMRELQRKLEHDAKLQHFYNVKGKRRINTELEAREANKKLQQREEFDKQLTEHKNIIFKIKHLTNEFDLDKLALQYTTQEEENFALFNYVNELSHEVETLNDLVQKFGDEIEKQKEYENIAAMKRETETMAHLEQEKCNTQDKANKGMENKNLIDERHKFLLCGIENIFRLTKSREVPILSVLGSKNFITRHNVQLFLGVIEKRVSAILCNVSLEECKILAKKDRIPKFNVKDYVKIKV